MTDANTPLPDPPLDESTSFLQSNTFNTLARFFAFLLVFSFFAILVEDWSFIKARNLENILRQSAVYATAALGMTMIIITAGIDLSIGSVIAICVVGVAWVLNLRGADDQALIEQFPVMLPLFAVVMGIVLATLSGMFNGVLIVGLRLAPFIVTLGSMGIIRGVAKLIAQERDIYPPESTWIDIIMDPTLVPFLNWLGGDGPRPSGLGWLVLPLGVWIMLISAVAAALLLRYTRFGRHVYAVGSNEETARLCGVPVGRTKIIVYALAGFFAALAGMMQFSYIGGIGQPTTAVAYELYVIAAVVVGGASLMGGEGTILGSIIGALTITVLYMGGQQAGWDKPVQEIMIGGIIIAAAALDQLRHRGRT